MNSDRTFLRRSEGNAHGVSTVVVNRPSISGIAHAAEHHSNGTRSAATNDEAAHRHGMNRTRRPHASIPRTDRPSPCITNPQLPTAAAAAARMGLQVAA